MRKTKNPMYSNLLDNLKSIMKEKAPKPNPIIKKTILSIVGPIFGIVFINSNYLSYLSNFIFLKILISA
jgi:hypothetical protein